MVTQAEQMATQPRVQKRLYSVREAGAYLGRTPNAVRELIWKGKLPSVRFDRRIFLDRQDLDTFIEGHKIREHF